MDDDDDDSGNGDGDEGANEEVEEEQNDDVDPNDIEIDDPQQQEQDPNYVDPNDIEIDDPQMAGGDGGGDDGGGDGGGGGGGGDDGGGGGGGDNGDNGDDEELAAAPVDLPQVDDDVYSGRDAFANADDEDFEDDSGDWSADDYHESAQNLFGEHEHWGDTAEKQYADEGFSVLGTMNPVVQDVRRQMPEVSTIDFYEKDGAVVPRGFLSAAALAALELAFPALVLDFLHVTVDRHPLDAEGGDRTPRELPDELRNVNPADSVDLRKYATAIGDQGSTSRCAAFAWTHALEMLGNIRNQPYPPLACSFTMLLFQERQGDSRSWEWAWKGGDGTSGTWEPGRHLFANGTCRHDMWPNDEQEPRTSIEAMRDDARAHTFDAEVYNVTIEDMKKLLSSGLPVQISMATGEAFQDIGRDGVMKVAEAPKGQHGYHAMLCVGYIGNYFIVKNSWGTEWGDNGYCYIPKVVLADSEPEAVAIVPKKLEAKSA